MGITDPVATFSACYGEAFLPLHPFTYAKMLAEKVEQHHSNVWLVNTGWTGGQYGKGSRMTLKYTRRIIDGIHNGSFDNCDYKTFPIFNLQVPTECPGVPSEILWPQSAWDDQDAFQVTLRKLAEKFQENFKKYEDETPREVIEKGGPMFD
mmetsp:Transcript_2731/g.4605  ORF Transcript_2731/g.4605 Transcript_2731/m.4605 type:complete len:151 (+) Transcript_2731:3-455(+)